jgi:N-acetylmuramoyl-L-alanine amidase
MALSRISIPSPNYSSRGGSKVRLVVLHTAEGARTYKDLGAFFANSASGVSSHAGIDDTPNTIGVYVRREYKAWTQANYNSVADSAELCGFAAWTHDEWVNKHAVMLDNTAKWVVEECSYYGIPIRRLSASEAQGSSAGVCQHIDLGAGGGGHVDCDYGTGNFPMDQIISAAKQYAAGGTPQPTPTTNFWEEDMIIVEPDGTVLWSIMDGVNTYWRTVPANAAKLIPDSMKIKDDGSLKSLWKVGSK